MGYYTELKFSCQLSKDAPFNILEGLFTGELQKELYGGEVPQISSVSETPNLPIEHEFGKSERWDQMLNPYTMKLNTDRKTLKVNCDIKAYDNIYEHFINWLEPFIISGTASIRREDGDGFIKIFTK